MLRAFRVKTGGKAVGLRAAEAEALVPDARIFVQRIRRNGVIEEATADTVLREGDVVAVAGARDVLVKLVGEGAKEVEDPELLNVPVAGVDIYVTNKAMDGKTLVELAKQPDRQRASSCGRSRGAQLPRISPSCRTPRSSAATSSPSSAARRTSMPRPSCWASRIAGPTLPTSRSSAPRSCSAHCSARSSSR